MKPAALFADWLVQFIWTCLTFLLVGLCWSTPAPVCPETGTGVKLTVYRLLDSHSAIFVVFRLTFCVGWQHGWDSGGFDIAAWCGHPPHTGSNSRVLVQLKEVLQGIY